MKKTIITAIVALLTVPLYAQKQTYSISGHLDGLEAKTVFLDQSINGNFIVIDSSKVVDGNFSFKGKVNNGIGSAAIRVPRVRGYATVFFEKGAIKLNGKTNNLFGSEIKGGKNSEKLCRFYKDDAFYYDESMRYLDLYQSNVRTKNKDSVSYYLAKHKEFLAKVDSNKVAMINSKSAAALYYYRAKVMSKITSYEEIERFLVDYEKGFESNNDLAMIRKHASTLKTIGVGTVIEDITLPDMNDNIFSVSSLRGKYVLIDFWASWCSPCRREAREILKFYSNYAGEKFEILGVSIDETKERWTKAIDEDKTPWMHILDKESKYKKLFAISAVPRMIFISPEGKIIDNNITTEKLLEQLKEIFGK